MPVTRTESVLFTYAVVTESVGPVAPLIAAPFASHWYERVVPGVHDPAFAVREYPTRAVPEILGAAT